MRLAKKQKSNQRKPEISVCIPVFNQEHYLADCLDSVLNQTFQDFEIICVNDGSTDSSQEILNQYAQKEKRILIINQKNKGLSGARNTALDNIHGKYVVFLDSDDQLPPNALKTLWQVAEKTKAPLVASRSICLGNSSNVSQTSYKVYSKAPFQHFIKDNKIFSSAWNKIYTHQILKDHRFIEGIYFEDWPFLITLMGKINFYATTQEPCYIYTQENPSITRSTFNQKKTDSYLKGIQSVYEFYHASPLLRLAQKRMGIAMKMLINKTYKTKNKELKKYVFKACLSLLKKKVVYWQDLPFKTLFRLYRMK